MHLSRSLRFYPLTVAALRHDTRDSVVATLSPQPEDAEQFSFIQGQYLTFRRIFDGVEIRRSYSICAGLDDGVLRVGIRRADGGAFSVWANDKLAVGDVLEAMPPMGSFHLPLDPTARHHYLGFAGGSGITPLVSIIKTVLAREPGSRFTLVYTNRQVSTIMFREELEDLKDRYLERFALLHILTRQTGDIDLFSGRIDKAKCGALMEHWIDIGSVDAAFICGPQAMMETTAEALRARGLRNDQIKIELFKAGQPGRLKQRTAASDTAETGEVRDAAVIIDGMSRPVRLARQGQTLLEAALTSGIDAPYACKAGVCSTCRARLVDGEVDMIANNALEEYEIQQGYILSCQSLPLTERVVWSYDL